MLVRSLRCRLRGRNGRTSSCAASPGILSPSHRQEIVSMTNAIAHRGPDACGLLERT